MSDQPSTEIFAGLRVRSVEERAAYLNDLDAALAVDPEVYMLTLDQIRWRRIGPEARTVLREIALRTEGGL